VFDLLEPNFMDVDIRDIAFSLSRLCRFTGHSSEFYSVAQHCIQVSFIVPKKLALQGLLHDASEAYIGDVSQPLKRALGRLAPGALPIIEDRIHAAIAAKFRTQWPHDPRVKDADLRALATEVRDLMPAAAYWDEQQLPEPLPLTITPFSPKDAEKKYLERFREVS